jgi:hypothetical protein
MTGRSCLRAHRLVAAGDLFSSGAEARWEIHMGGGQPRCLEGRAMVDWVLRRTLREQGFAFGN